MKGDLRHILFVTDAFHPESGGVERVCRELAKAFVRRDLRVTVVARMAPGRREREVIDGIRVYRYRHAQRFAPRVYLSHIRATRKIAAHILRDDPPDAAHLHLSLSAQGPLGVLSRAGVPVVASFYGPWHKEFHVEAEELHAKSGALYRTYLRGLERLQAAMQRRMIRLAQGLVVLSDFSRGELLELAPEAEGKIVKIPGGIDPAVFHPGKPGGRISSFGFAPGRPTLVTARRLVRRTGVDLLLEAVALLAAQGSAMNLIVAGEGPMRPDLERRARELGLTEGVRFIGFVKDTELAGLYRECDLFVLPTREQENFGLPVLEASACGCPVAATPVGSIPEVMALAGQSCVSETADAVSLARTIRRALGDAGAPVERREKIAADVAGKYSWDAIAAQHIDHYKKVLACASR